MMKNIKNTKGDNDENKQTTSKFDLLSRPSCRICLKGEDKKNVLIRVCKCENLFELVHSKCIENWIQLTNNEFCDICKYKFKFKKYSMGYSDFIRLEYQDNTNFINFLIITLLVLYVLSIGFALSYICYDHISVLIGSILFVTSAIFLGIFILFILTKLINELIKFIKWKFNHYCIRILKY